MCRNHEKTQRGRKPIEVGEVRVAIIRNATWAKTHRVVAAQGAAIDTWDFASLPRMAEPSAFKKHGAAKMSRRKPH